VNYFKHAKVGSVTQIYVFLGCWRVVVGYLIGSSVVSCITEPTPCLAQQSYQAWQLLQKPALCGAA
jgi:hypothetical protein